MNQQTLSIRGHRVATPGGVRPASIHIRDGIITGVGGFDDVSSYGHVVNAGEEIVILPGLVDTHVHINEPGRTEWEGFASATRAAAAGGVTTLVDMPLNCIPATTTLAGLETKLASAKGQCWVDVGFWGGVVPGNLQELSRMFEAGVSGFKCFLVPSGVDEFPAVTARDLRPGMAELARLRAPLLVHAELPGPIEKALAVLESRSAADPRRYSTYLESRPREAENEAVSLIVGLCRETGCAVHIVHHSSSDALAMIREARASGLPVTVETCPHYLFFAAEAVPDGATEFKCSPPIREAENSEKLWAALDEGVIDMIVSDHSPCPEALKQLDTGDFMSAWGGISSLQLRLAAVWTPRAAKDHSLLQQLVDVGQISEWEAETPMFRNVIQQALGPQSDLTPVTGRVRPRQRKHSIDQLVEWLCAAPARLAGLSNRKGSIAPGFDADLVFWNPDAQFKVEPAVIHHRHTLSPYNGESLSGVVERTFLRGAEIYHQGRFSGPFGSLLKRVAP